LCRVCAGFPQSAPLVTCLIQHRAHGAAGGVIGLAAAAAEAELAGFEERLASIVATHQLLRLQRELHGLHSAGLEVEAPMGFQGLCESPSVLYAVP